MHSKTNVIACGHALLGLAIFAATLGGMVIAQDYSVYTSWDDMDKATDAKYATVTRVSGTRATRGSGSSAPSSSTRRTATRSR